MDFPAVVAAGDRGAAKAIYGESKAYLEIEGRPLVSYVIAMLQRVPEISEVWVVGDADRLRPMIDGEPLRSELRKPIHIVPQFKNLLENVWETYRRLLPDAGPQGREPRPEDHSTRVLYLSSDLPFATPQEISEFVRRAGDLDCDYALGLVTEESMEDFYPSSEDEPGIRMAYFNLREGRFRQSNLHLVRPARIGSRQPIQEMYANRHQREWRAFLALAWRLTSEEKGGLRVLFYYVLMHLASVADRRGWGRIADWLRRRIPVPRIEGGVSSLLRASFRLVVTDVGGSALDIDNEHDYDVAKQRYRAWSASQKARAEEQYGPLPLPPGPREKLR